MSKLFWNPEKRRYEKEDGTVVPFSEPRKWVDELGVAVALFFMSLALQAKESGEYQDLKQWSDTMRFDLEHIHRSAVIVAAGGVAQMDDDLWNYSDQKTREHRSFLDAFLAGVYSGSVPMDGNFVQRAGLYPAGAYSTYEGAVVIREGRAGMNLYARLLDPGAEHCEQCPGYAFDATGWQPIGSLPNIGEQCDCRARCRCHFIFKQGSPADVGSKKRITIPQSWRTTHA